MHTSKSSANTFFRICTWVLFTLAASFSHAADTPLRIAVAANFKPVLETLVTQFEQESGIDVTVSAGSTGALYAQIKHGAPFDIFFSADTAKPVSLESAGLTRLRQTYVYGRLAFWMPGATTVDESTASTFAGSLAIANPQHAPYGQAAIATIDRVGQSDTRIVRGNNVALTYAFIETGNVAAGYVALSQLKITNQPVTSYWLVPASYHDLIEQQLVIMKRADQRADQFLTHLQTSNSQALITRAGYLLPPTSPTP